MYYYKYKLQSHENKWIKTQKIKTVGQGLPKNVIRSGIFEIQTVKRIKIVRWAKIENRGMICNFVVG